MTTFKGAMRSYTASVRRMEREQQRKARESAKKFKEQQKFQEIQNAGQAVKDWKDYVSMLVSLHKNCTDGINWATIRGSIKPIPPAYSDINESIAKSKHEHFKPSFLDKVFGSTKRKLSNLVLNIASSKAKDEKNYKIALADFTKKIEEWEELQNISNGILANDPESYLRALQFFNPFDDIGELGSQVSFQFLSDFIDIDLHINSKDTIPDYEVKQLASGKLSKREMSASKFNELYQDHVCSAVIRIAREVFAYLPVDKVRVSAVSDLLNQKTGHLEEKPVLSVIFSANTISLLNLQSIDPSDSMQNFVHSMNFKKTSGFSEVVKAVLS